MAESELRPRHSKASSSSSTSRSQSYNIEEINRHAEISRQEEERERKRKVLPDWHWLILLVLNAAILFFLHRTNNIFPEPLTVKSAGSGRFVEEIARKTLNGLVGIGSRPVGSEQNEKLAVEYILHVIEGIQQGVKGDVHNIEVDVQKVSGSFDLNFLGGFTSVYENVNNIVVRLTPAAWNRSGYSGPKSTVLVNCHYDTAINSTGASDDGVSCAIMLEVLRVISTDPKPLQHGVVFLFNGAEENILQASHGFITQHKWVKEIRAFVNLEAAGAGGRELLFQAGPEHPWLVWAYAGSAPHPFASIFAQEVFDSGVIPSDTDFRIFRDYGNLPGLDVAYITNGYVYHTPADLPDKIPPGCIQRGGDNLLAIVKAIANSPHLEDPGEYRQGKLVYFDVIGYFMVVYTLKVSTFINLFCLVVLCVQIRSSMHKAGSVRDYVKRLLVALGVIASVCVVVILTVVAVAFYLDIIAHHPMSWFTNVWLIFGLFLAPAIAASFSWLSLLRRCVYRNGDGFREFSACFDAAMVFFGVILAALTVARIGSAILVLFYVVSQIFTRAVVEFIEIKFCNRFFSNMWLLVHYTGLLVPNAFFMYAIYDTLLMFVPIMGRTANMILPDIVIAVIVGIGFIGVFFSHIGLVFIGSSCKRVILVSLAVFAVSLFVALFTQTGFPYDATVPIRQRHILHHVDRRFRNSNNEIIGNDSGILHLPFDRNGVELMRSHVPLLKNARTLICKENLPYCGMPFYFPMVAFFPDWLYIPTTPLGNRVGPIPQLSVVGKTVLPNGIVRVKMLISGPCHINVYIAPKDYVNLVGWSLGKGRPNSSGMPSSIKRRHYFVYYSYGTPPERPWELSIDVMVNELGDRGMGLVDIALGGHYLSLGDGKALSQELEDYVKSMPDWSVPIGWVATYDSWVIA